MYGIALALLSFGPTADPIKLPSDVIVYESRAFAMPVKLPDEWKDKVKEIRLLVSEDRGKSWKHESDYKSTADQVTFEAPEDGLYWFGIQFVLKDGTKTPDEPKKIIPQMKVFVNTSGKKVSVQKSYTELLQENEELRKKVEELEKKLARQPGDKPR